MGRECCENLAPPPTAIGGAPVGDGGRQLRGPPPIGNRLVSGKRYAMSHSCPNQGTCIALVDKSGNWLGCYSANDLEKGAASNDISIQSMFRGTQKGDGGQCNSAGCDMKVAHVHAYVRGELADGGSQERILPSCANCNCGEKGKACPVWKEQWGELQQKLTGNSLEPEAVTVQVRGEEDTTAKTTELKVEGICCASEVPLVERLLSKLPGVRSVAVNVTTQSVFVVHDSGLSSPDDLAAALNRAGLRARVKGGSKGGKLHFSDCWRRTILVLAGLCLGVALASTADPNEEDWVHELKYVALGAFVLGIPPIAKRAFAGLRMGILDINSLMLIAAIGAIVIGEYIEAGAVVFLFGLSELLEGAASARVRNAMSALFELRPEVAVLASGQQVPVEQVLVGDLLAVRTGEKVPVDGEVVEGSSSLDESALSGESKPKRKILGSKVSAGTINVGGGYLVIRATAMAKDSAVAKMLKLIEDAHASRSKTERRVETFAKFYTPVVVSIAVIIAATPWLFLSRQESLAWVKMALILLVVACPCALVISTPITYVSTLATAATHQVLIRGGEYLEELGSISTMCLDKTGTLTEGRFAVQELLSPFAGDKTVGVAGGFLASVGLLPNQLTEARLIRLVAAVAKKSSHPIAAALVAHSRIASADSGNLEATDFMEYAGKGTEAMVGGLHVRVGSKKFAGQWNTGFLAKGAGTGKLRAQSQGCFAFPSLKKSFSPKGADFRGSSTQIVPSWGLAEAELRARTLEKAGQTICYVAINGSVAGIFGIADAPRPEAQEAVRRLQELGVEAVMLTGDRRATAESVAAKLGISLKNVRAELLPEDKVAAIRELRGDKARLLKKSPFPCLGVRVPGVAMVGDGINDAAALASANVGIAMGATGTFVAVDSAHVVLMDSDLSKLVLSVQLGRTAVRKIKQNITFALFCKALMLGLTFGGYATLWGAILADLGSMLIVTLNASMVLSLKKKKPKESVDDQQDN